MTRTIFAYGNASNPGATVASLPAIVKGCSWMFRWADIEPTQGVFNWAAIDAAIAAAGASSREVMLRVIAGADSPSWVKPTVTFYEQPPGPVPPHQVTMPIPWDTGFLAAWTTFIAAYGARYNANPHITVVQMPGAGILGEMGLGGWLSTKPTPQSLGATDALFIAAWTQIIDAYRAAFPLVPTALDLGDPLMDGHVEPAVLAHARTYAPHVWVQHNNLAATVGASVLSDISGAAAWTTSGWQMWAGGQSAGQLGAALETATDSNASYVEVYARDCAAKANLAALTAFVSS